MNFPLQLPDTDWRPVVDTWAASPVGQKLLAYLAERHAAGATIYPPEPLRALTLTPLSQTRVVILGQDPYHGPGQAEGLSFSVPEGVPFPPSLRNIFKEIQRDLGLPVPSHGCLRAWADQGVLLLNAVLSVEDGRAGSHAGRGWEGFTDAAIEALSREREGLVFLLWGSYAQKKGAIIDRQRHCVLQAPHPSPLSAHRGFLGCGHFGKANRWLQGRGLAPIDWGLPVP